LESLKLVWSKLDARRRVVVVAATLATLAAVALLAQGPGPGRMALLYAGLDPAAAGEVVTALESRGTPYEVRGDAIWVPESSRDLERMALAGEGLPASSGGGYELLDELSGFGTTSQMFDAAYWRAKEGELARTILASPQIRTARVHISAAPQRAFGEAGEATAAVTVTTRGGAVEPAQAQALRHLVAAAVPGLRPADVAVIDGEGGLVPDAEAEGAPATRAEELRARAERLLEARVGPGNAVVEVSVETVTATESLRERTVDPASRVAISTEAEESASTSQGGAGAVTVASNLPEGDAGGGEGPSSEGTETRTLTNYEISETSREVIRAPGDVRRLTVAVLVNDVVAVAEDGTQSVTARAPDELGSLGELVASAVGLDPSRGDVITVKSMPFEPVAALGSGPAEPLSAPFDLAGLIRPALLALVALGLGLFVVRPILRGSAVAALPAPAIAAPLALSAEGPRAVAGTVLEAGAIEGPGAAAALAPPEGSEAGAGTDPVARLRRLIESREVETAQLLQSWIDTPRERA
jgi:flagellar M-ring protein FliF